MPPASCLTFFCLSIPLYFLRIFKISSFFFYFMFLITGAILVFEWSFKNIQCDVILPSMLYLLISLKAIMIFEYFLCSLFYLSSKYLVLFVYFDLSFHVRGFSQMQWSLSILSYLRELLHHNAVGLYKNAKLVCHLKTSWFNLSY